jgi:hypothetical protein
VSRETFCPIHSECYMSCLRPDFQSPHLTRKPTPFERQDCILELLTRRGRPRQSAFDTMQWEEPYDCRKHRNRMWAEGVQPDETQNVLRLVFSRVETPASLSANSPKNHA